MREVENYIPAYGANNEIHWFPMKIAKSRIAPLQEVLEKESIEYFAPTNEEVVPRPNGHKMVQIPMVDLIFIHSSKDKIEQLKQSNNVCHSLCFTTEIPYSEIKRGMTELGKRKVNRIIIVDDQSMARFLDNINKIRNKVTLLQYSETFSHIGKRIRIIDGPLAGIEGVLRRVKGNKHVHLDLGNLLTAQIDYVPGYMYELMDNSEVDT